MRIFTSIWAVRHIPIRPFAWISQNDKAQKAYITYEQYKKLARVVKIDGTKCIKGAYFFRNDPSVVFTPDKSNFTETVKAAKREHWSIVKKKEYNL